MDLAPVVQHGGAGIGGLLPALEFRRAQIEVVGLPRQGRIARIRLRRHEGVEAGALIAQPLPETYPGRTSPTLAFGSCFLGVCLPMRGLLSPPQALPSRGRP